MTLITISFNFHYSSYYLSATFDFLSQLDRYFPCTIIIINTTLFNYAYEEMDLDPTHN